MRYTGYGNITGLTDPDGEILERYEYSPYGKVKILDKAGNIKYNQTTGEPMKVSEYKNPYLFQSRRLDSWSGHYYFRNRYYDPDTGRFLTRDPARDDSLGNLYAFVNNNPVNYVDPWGLEGELPKTEIEKIYYAKWTALDKSLQEAILKKFQYKSWRDWAKPYINASNMDEEKGGFRKSRVETKNVEMKKEAEKGAQTIKQETDEIVKVIITKPDATKEIKCMSQKEFKKIEGTNYFDEQGNKIRKKVARKRIKNELEQAEKERKRRKKWENLVKVIPEAYKEASRRSQHAAKGGEMVAEYTVLQMLTAGGGKLIQAASRLLVHGGMTFYKTTEVEGVKKKRDTAIIEGVTRGLGLLVGKYFEVIPASKESGKVAAGAAGGVYNIWIKWLKKVSRYKEPLNQ